MPIISKDVWITREGKQMEIRTMASSHLLSTIHFIERNRFMNAAEVYTERQLDNATRNEAVNYYLMWPIQYETLVAEAQRRNLIFRPIQKSEPSLVTIEHLKGGTLTEWLIWLKEELHKDGRTPMVYHPSHGREVYEHIMTAFIEIIEKVMDKK